jgi:hypothetical protein
MEPQSMDNQEEQSMFSTIGKQQFVGFFEAFIKTTCFQSFIRVSGDCIFPCPVV